MSSAGMYIGGGAASAQVGSGFGLAATQAATPRTQYESLCEAIGERLMQLSAEISTLHATCSPILPGEPTAEGKASTNVKPVGHSSPMMNFLEHIGEQIAQMEERVRYIRVRTPF